MKVFTFILLLIALNCCVFVHHSFSQTATTTNDFELSVSARESLIALSNMTTLDKIKEQYTNVLTDSKLKLNDVEKTRLIKQNELEMIQTVYRSLSSEDKAEADIFIQKAQSQLLSIKSISNEFLFKIKMASSAIIKIDEAISKIIGNYASLRFAITSSPSSSAYDDGLLMVDTNSTIYGIGYNLNGNLGCGNFDNPVATPCKTFAEPNVLGGKVVSVMQSKFHTVVLTTDNTLVAFGHGLYGSLGNGKTVNSNVPVLVDNTLFKGKTIKQVEVGTLTTIIVTTDDKMYGWGYNGNGELCLGQAKAYIATPVAIPAFAKKIKKVAYKQTASLFLTETGEVYYCGRLDAYSTNSVVTYTKIDTSVMGTDLIEEVSPSSTSVIYRTASGNLYGIGQNDNGVLGLGDSIARTQPTLISYFKNNGIFITKVCSGSFTSVALSKEGKVYAWGMIGKQTNIKTLPYRYINNEIDKYNIVEIYCGGSTIIAVSENGMVFGWGNSPLFGNNVASLEPVKLELPHYY